MAPLKLKIVLVCSVLLMTSGAVAVVALRQPPVASADGVITTESEGWYCPMHPDVKSDHEGNCPICGMQLVKEAEAPHTSDVDRFYVVPQAQQRIGLLLVTVEPFEFQPSIRVAAQVVADERRAVTLSPKVEGWIKRLGVAVIGQRVHIGQMLYEIYSPELQQRERDYLDLLARRDSLLEAGGVGAAAGNSPPDLMLASVARERYRMRARLIAADVPPAILEDLERFRRVTDVVPVLAGHEGVVTGIGVREGGYVRPGEIAVSYADRRAAWAELSMNPEILDQINSGDEVELRSTVNPATSIFAPIDTSLAIIDPISRTARLRVPLPPRGNSFLPGTLLAAQIRMKARKALTLPSDTILRTGHGDFVIVSEGDNHFRQQAVRLGAQSGDRVEMLDGLRAGQSIVANGQFLMSAESSLQSSRRRLVAR